MTKAEAIESAKVYLRGEDTLQKAEFDSLYTSLIEFEQFGYATELILKKIKEDSAKGIDIPGNTYQKIARNVYKDTTLSSYFKYDKALSILSSRCHLSTTGDCETLGLAGAILKYKWKFDFQLINLLKSREYYKKGYLIWKNSIQGDPCVETDHAYTAINYAYINELIICENLKQLADLSGVTEEIIENFKITQSVRKEIITKYIDNPGLVLKPFVKPNEWLYATLAEAYFGLKEYHNALHFITKYTANKNSNWQIKTFTDQLYHIASFQEYEKRFETSDRDPFNTKGINEELKKECLLALDISAKPEHKAELIKRSNGKVGLALSGGGFRASLFHIGVLAALAERDELKDIEVISCVSGGSIIGAYYYLKLRNLLETKDDLIIKKEDYIEIVKDIEKAFLEAVQKNLRMRLFTSFPKNIKMLFSGKYSRSHRLGELYEEYFYKPLLEEIRKKNKKSGSVPPPTKDNANQDEIYINNLFVNIPGFSISSDNPKRRNKVPQLILNATSLNTGHNWQFTASWMGEPPTTISGDFDAKPRLRRMYYKDAPPEYQQFRLGYAVAASSCVPVLFEPLILKDLYKDIDLELVDGGVHDNQGITSILEQECNNIIVSDGSAQLPEDMKNTDNELALFLRVDNVVQERIRETQLLDLKMRDYASSLLDLKIIHLKNDLAQLPVSWINCTDVNRKILHDMEIEEENSLTDYGLMKKTQKLLSEVRTDLDSFNDLEAYALMYSGYRQMKHGHSSRQEIWEFLKIENSCKNPQEATALNKQLEVSKNVPFKLMKMSKIIAFSVYLIFAAIIISFIVYLCKNWDNPDSFICQSITYKSIGVALLIWLIGYISQYSAAIINWKGIIRKKLIMVGVITIGWIAMNLYVGLLNPVYNRLGRIKKK